MESSLSISRINIVFFTESETESRNLASEMLANKHSEDVWQDQVDGVDVFGYIRWPAAIATATPVGITDILIVHVSTDDSEKWESTKKYIDSRRSIPFKFLSSASDLSAQAASLDSEFVNAADVTVGNFRDKAIRSALNLEKTLRDTFSKIDSDADGFIEAEEIITASKSLGHPLNDEDAKEIVKSLSTDGKVNFEKFKQWWIMGRADFGTFRKIVELEMIMNNYIKQSSDIFNSYLEKIQKEGHNIENQEAGLQGRTSIGSVQEFESGIALGVHVTAGNDFAGIVDSFPAELRASPASFGFEFKLKKAEDAKDLIKGIELIKEQLSKNTPMIRFLLKNGSLTTTTRQVGTSVFLDLIPSGGFRDQMSGVLGMFELSQINFNGISDIHLATKFALKDLFEMGLNEIVENAVHFRFEGKAEWGHLKNLFRFICDMLVNIPLPRLPFELKHLAFALRFVAAFRKINFDFKFDPKSTVETIKDIINITEKSRDGEEDPAPWEIGCIKMAKFQSKALKEIKSVPPNVKAVMNPLKKALQAINLDDISIFATAPLLKVHLKVNLMIKGLSEKIDEIFYSTEENKSE